MVVSTSSNVRDCATNALVDTFCAWEERSLLSLIIKGQQLLQVVSQTDVPAILCYISQNQTRALVWWLRCHGTSFEVLPRSSAALALVVAAAALLLHLLLLWRAAAPLNGARMLVAHPDAAKAGRNDPNLTCSCETVSRLKLLHSVGRKVKPGQLDDYIKASPQPKQRWHSISHSISHSSQFIRSASNSHTEAPEVFNVHTSNHLDSGCSFGHHSTNQHKPLAR